LTDWSYKGKSFEFGLEQFKDEHIMTEFPLIIHILHVLNKAAAAI